MVAAHLKKQAQDQAKKGVYVMGIVTSFLYS